MRNNPELQRLLWLEVTGQRLMLFPATIFGSAVLLNQSGAAPELSRALAVIGFALITIAWGARQCANSITDEAQGRTWELQRMSSLGPWPMTWGKLIGAGVMPWYGGMMCLACLLVTYPAAEIERAFESCVGLVLAAVVAQALALMIALLRVRLDGSQRLPLNIIVALGLLTLVVPDLAGLSVAGLSPLRDGEDLVRWYGLDYASTKFNLAVVGAAAAWAVVGAYRMMCTELAVRTTPWVWLLLVSSLALLASGLDSGAGTPPLAQRMASSAAVFACALSYVAGFALAADAIQYRRVIYTLRAGQYWRAWQDLPLWISSAAYALLFASVALVLGSAGAISNERPDNLGPVALVLTLTMLRDLSLLTYFNFRAIARRAEVTTLFILALINRVLPGALLLAGLHGAANLFRPTLFDDFGIALTVAAVQAVVALLLLLGAYRRATLPAKPI